ncbi:uncharacterized protein METZ01_LOCUS192290 [marine metagenome]|uniref:Uncharacterized protein n=1 Tax=marine metagenome TaxID=408172 RepID=A0A382DLS0_9ZZZZ
MDLIIMNGFLNRITHSDQSSIRPGTTNSFMLIH